LLLRSDDAGVLAIGQPSHAWVSGQLARAWGNEQFGAVEPYEEVCLAAEQHDIGMAAWDLRPSWNPSTELPHAFTEMPLPVHVELWSAGPQKLLRQSRYAALLVSMHGMRLYELRDLDRLPAAEADDVRKFLDAQRAFQRELVSTLRADRLTSAAARGELVARNSDLLWTWDFVSLALCLRWPPCSARNVPTASGAVELELAPTATAGRIKVEPWPFRDPAVNIQFEGQRLSGCYRSEGELHDALAHAPWETVELELVR
jgi:Protein of unknown function (DUF3891)